MSTQIEQIKKVMEKEARKVNFWTRAVFLVVVLCLTVGIILLTTEALKSPPRLLKNWIIGLLFCVPATISVIVFLAGLIIFRPEERVMVEFLGKPFCVKMPGLRWVCPILMNKRMVAYTWEQAIQLFPDRTYPDGVHIDLKGGGKTQLVDPVLWVQLLDAGTDRENENILRMVYGIDNWIKAVQESGEDALRTCLNNLTVEEVLSVVHDAKKASWWDAIKEHFPELEVTIKGYGLIVNRLTISDFNWDKRVIDVRQEIFAEERSITKAKLSKRAAKDEVAQEALEIGGLYGEVARLLTQKQYGGHTSEDARKAAMTLWTYSRGTKMGSIIDTRSDGGVLSSLVSAAVAIAKNIKINSQPATKVTTEETKETEETSE